MFSNPHFDRVRQMFADQFQTDGDGLVYRKSLKGAPVPVTALERDRFVADFNRRLTFVIWGAFLVFVIMMAGAVGVMLELDQDLGDVWTYAIVAVPLAVMLLAWYWLWGAPARALGGRSAVGPQLSRDELRRTMLARMSWVQLASSLIPLVYLLTKVNAKYDLLYGWNRLWLVGAAAYLALLSAQAYRKWRNERTGAS